MLLHKTHKTKLEKETIIGSMIEAGFTQVSTEGYFIGDGHLLFDDGKPEPIPPEPLVFTASPPGIALGKRLNNIEDFLERLYPG